MKTILRALVWVGQIGLIAACGGDRSTPVASLPAPASSAAPAPSASPAPLASPAPFAPEPAPPVEPAPPAEPTAKPIEEPIVALPACTPGTWLTLDERTFTFSVPCGMKRRQIHGIDSQVGQFESSDLVLHYDYGRYGTHVDGMESGRVSHEVIGGRAATITTAAVPGLERGFTGMAVAQFPSVMSGGKIKLTMWAECKAPADQETAKKVFRSIRFPK